MTAQRIGAYEYYDPSGRYVKHTPNHVQDYLTTESRTVTSPLVDTRSRIIADYLLFTAFNEFIIKDIDTLKLKKFDFHRTFNPMEPVDQVYQQITSSLRLEYLEEMEQTLAADKRKEDLIKRNYDTFESTAVFDFDGFLDGLIDIGVDFILGEVNKLLPAGYGISVDVDSNGFNGFSVAGIGYNAKENSLSYDGRLFNALLRGGVDLLNDLLPDFISAELGLNELRIGEVTVDFDELEEGVEVEVLGEVKVVKRLGEIFAVVSGKEINVANVLGGLVGATVGTVFDGGLASINRDLPEGLKVGVSFSQGSLLPKVSLGPVSLDLATGGLGLNVAALGSLADNALNRYVFTQLPAPLGAIARLAWKSFDLTSFIGDVIDSTPPSPEKNISITPSGTSSLPRLVSSPPVTGNLPTRSTQ